MTCQVILEFKAKQDSIEGVRTFFREILADTRAYEGCVGLNVTQNQDDPAEFVLVQQWDKRANYEAYLKWRMESGAMDAFTVMIDGEPKIRFFDYSGV